MKRNFERDEILIICGLKIEDQIFKASMYNFSRMGALVSTPFELNPGKFISLAYQNEKNEIVQMLTYVVHAHKKRNRFFAGLQFVGIESRR
ncbi:MAG: PilZ domain-containing protein [Pseudobdellovibrio sp.]